MPRGSNQAYTANQQHKAAKIEESYEARGIAKPEAEARAWATVNKQDGGGARAGSGRETPASAKTSARKDSAKHAVATKQGHSPNKGSARSKAA